MDELEETYFKRLNNSPRKDTATGCLTGVVSFALTTQFDTNFSTVGNDKLLH